MHDFEQQLQKMQTQPGFIAALDQSGGSTPKALALYGIKEDAWSKEDEMFTIVHQMRTRIITSPSFTGERLLGAILFESTMDREVEGQATADYLWNVRRVVPFLKVDKGLAAVQDGVQLMKPIPGLATLLDRAKAKRIFGTKMRSLIKQADAGAPTLKGNPERCGRTPIQWPAPERGQRAWLKWPLVTRLLTLVANSPDGKTLRVVLVDTEAQDTDGSETLFARLRRVRIQGPTDLSTNHDAYVVGERDE